MPRGFAGHNDGFEIDARALSALARDLKNIDRDLRKSLLRRVREAAGPAKEAVQREGSFSRRIPGAVRVRSSYAAKGAKVRVIVDSKRAPNAAPINNRDRAGTFRHPVFGDRNTWATQTAVPFMAAAADSARPEVLRRLSRVYDDVARAAHFTD